MAAGGRWQARTCSSVAGENFFTQRREPFRPEAVAINKWSCFPLKICSFARPDTRVRFVLF